MRHVSFHTLGCKLNFSETSTLARLFEAAGYVRTTAQGADVCVVNTCSVTEHSDRKCRNLIRRLVRENPGAVIAVTGCYAQLKPDAVAAIEGVDLVIGNDIKGEVLERVEAALAKRAFDRGKDKQYFNYCGPSAGNFTPGVAALRFGLQTGLPNHLPGICDPGKTGDFFPAFSSGDRTRTFLKVQDGCDYGCTYCTIPRARGASRNIPIAEIVATAHGIAASGQREIVLTGVNTGDFGRTTGESFLDLLRALDAVEGIERYRISSIEPNLLSDEIIAFTATSGKFQPHFHVPLQSGCDRILALMRRRYNTSMFAARIAKVREAMPESFIGIDVIVGFPGETEEDFRRTFDFLEEIRPAFLHVFPYSVRPGTPAADMPGRVDPKTAAARVKALTELSDTLHGEFCGGFVGRRVRVLWESTVRGGRMSGFTEHYVRVSAPWDASRVGIVDEVVIGEKLVSLHP